MANFTIGEIVQVPNKSGIYIGEIMEDRGDKYLIQTLAVLKHPMQGDLHHPKQVENVVFHERKALSQFEKFNVLKDIVSAYTEKVPAYGESLKKAVVTYKEQLTSKTSDYNTAALKALEIVENSYYLGRYYN
jgi:kinase-associated protein B